MATLTETGEFVFAVLDETGRRRLSTLVLDDGARYFVPTTSGGFQPAWAARANSILMPGRPG